MYKKSPLSPP